MRLLVRLLPRARADRIEGVAHLAGGSAVLKVSVGAPPVDNRANESLLQLLAQQLQLPRRDLTLVGGAKSRTKVVHIAGSPTDLMRRLQQVLADLCI